MVSVTGNSFPICASVPLAVASIVSGLDLSCENAGAFPKLSRPIDSRQPMVSFSLFLTQSLICDISPPLRVQLSLRSAIDQSNRCARRFRATNNHGSSWRIRGCAHSLVTWERWSLSKAVGMLAFCLFGWMSDKLLPVSGASKWTIDC